MRQMVVNFLGGLEVEVVGDTAFKLVAPFTAVIEEIGQPLVRIVVPAGFITNFASVPRVPIAFELFGGIGDKAATVHDFLYSKASGDTHARNWCDAVFHHAMLSTGVSPEKAQLMYDAVRVGGGAHWKVD